MRLFSTEQVTKYHPDKLCDQISDAIVDACIAQDPDSRVACEALAKGTTVVLAGEITTTAKVDYAAVAKRVCRGLGYVAEDVITLINQQSPEIASGIASGIGSGDTMGAGDQGIMYGYATNETPSMLPFGFDLANRLTARIEAEAEKNNPILTGEAKVQVTVDLDIDPTILSVRKILVSACHKPNVDFTIVRQYIETLVWSVVDEYLRPPLQQPPLDESWYDPVLRRNIAVVVNPAGPWTIGGPLANCGLTGRKIVCDQYGGYCPVGGGAFSGKDPSKVDRSASYMARKIACDIVRRSETITKCEVQLAYAIGQAKPVSISIKYKNAFMSSVMESAAIDEYDLTPAGIIKALDLKRPIYERLAGGCHYREGAIL